MEINPVDRQGDRNACTAETNQTIGSPRRRGVEVAHEVGLPADKAVGGVAVDHIAHDPRIPVDQRHGDIVKIVHRRECRAENGQPLGADGITRQLASRQQQIRGHSTGRIPRKHRGVWPVPCRILILCLCCLRYNIKCSFNTRLRCHPGAEVVDDRPRTAEIRGVGLQKSHGDHGQYGDDNYSRHKGCPAFRPVAEGRTGAIAAASVWPKVHRGR